MKIEPERNRLIAETLQWILKERFNESVTGKSLLCLEGFSDSVFKELKTLLSQEVDIFLAGETRGEDLVRRRNDSDSKRPLVIFIGAYFPESQSLAHFSRLSVQSILEEKRYRVKLLELTFREFENLNTGGKLQETVKKIVSILQPSLETLIDYLISVREELTPISRQDMNTLLYKIMGMALWRLGLFSYAEFITGNERNNPTGDDEFLKKSFETYLRHNLQYSSPGYRNRFTFEKLSEIDDAEQKKLLFDYARGIKIEECLERVDFIDVKKLLKRPRRDTNKKKSEKNNEDAEKEKSILEGIFRRSNQNGPFTCKFGDAEPFTITLEPIAHECILKPVAPFIQWNERLNEAIELYTKKEDDEERLDGDEETIEISVTFEAGENFSKTKDFLLDMSEFESKKKPNALPDWKELVKPSNDQAIIDAVDIFVKKRNEILCGIGNPGFVTLNMDIEEYIGSYLKLMIVLWKKAAVCAEHEWFIDFLKHFVTLDIDAMDSDERKVLPAHPYQLFIQRLMEVIVLELQEISDIDKKEEWFEKNDMTDICNDVTEKFAKCWPRYLGTDEGIPPLERSTVDNVDTGKIEIGYKTRSNNFPRKSVLRKTINPQIRHYVKENPLACHGIRLNVLNPFSGEGLFKAIEQLYKNRNKQDYPKFISLKAIGPNNADTLSHFDSQVEEMDKKEVDIFLKQSNSLLPFCRYEKQLVKEENWISSWIDENNSNDDKVDIFFAINPFWHKYVLQDDKMQTPVSESVDRQFEAFERGNLSITQLLAGPDRIYLRLALEALTIMAIKRSGERRQYNEKNANLDDYLGLFERMINIGEWAILQDQDINDFYAEELSALLKNKFKQSVSTLVQDSAQGGFYLFVTPSQDQGRQLADEGIPDHLMKDHSFRSWMAAKYPKFIENKEFVETFFKSSHQWLIPYDLLPDWFGDVIGNGEQTDNDEASEKKDQFLIRLIFKPGEGHNDDIHFGIQLFEIEDNNFRPLDKGNMMDFFKFMTIDVKQPSRLFDKLRRKSIYEILLPLITNPYQSWFLALLNRENVNFKNSLGEGNLEREKNSIGRLKVWELRRLTIHLIKLYSHSPGISHELAQTQKSFFNKIESQIPHFLRDCLEHLYRKKTDLFEEHSYLKKYIQT